MTERYGPRIAVHGHHIRFSMQSKMDGEIVKGETVLVCVVSQPNNPLQDCGAALHMM